MDSSAAAGDDVEPCHCHETRWILEANQCASIGGGLSETKMATLDGFATTLLGALRKPLCAPTKYIDLS